MVDKLIKKKYQKSPERNIQFCTTTDSTVPPTAVYLVLSLPTVWKHRVMTEAIKANFYRVSWEKRSGKTASQALTLYHTQPTKHNPHFIICWLTEVPVSEKT